MAYNQYLVYDINRTRHADHGGPQVYRRCMSVRDGDRCEYREHPGQAHAAQSGGHQWRERGLGVCSECGQPQYPLGVTPIGQDAPLEYRTLCCDDGRVERVDAFAVR